jgi:hypothetical protein
MRQGDNLPSDERGSQSNIEESARGFVGKHLCFGFGLLHLLYEPPNPGQRSLVTCRRDAHSEASIAVDCASDHPGSRYVVHRRGLTWNHGFIDTGNEAHLAYCRACKITCMKRKYVILLH